MSVGREGIRRPAHGAGYESGSGYESRFGGLDLRSFTPSQGPILACAAYGSWIILQRAEANCFSAQRSAPRAKTDRIHAYGFPVSRCGVRLAAHVAGRNRLDHGW